MSNEAPPEPFLLRVNVEYTPSPSDPKGADEFYKALGILVVAWGRLEGHFVCSLLTLLTLPGGEVLGKNVPMNWEGRAKVWSNAYETLPMLQQSKAAALQYLADMKDVASDRHAIVHALWERFDPCQPPSVGIVSIKRKNGTTDGLDIRRATITLQMLKDIGQKISRLNIQLMTFSQFLTDWRRYDKPPPADIRII